ncbi:MAG TPA: hypothetical protein VJ810_38090 [Blastocatellia bacterium]|nr:hypothetical protein [Blastocatellia bacterium]
MNDEWNRDYGRQTGELAPGEKLFVVHKPHSLDGFIELNASSRGIDLHRLAVNDAIRVRTENSEYRIVLLDPADLRVKVQGGSFFAKPTEAIIRGATVGGSMLKIGWIGVGLQVEFVYYRACDQMQSLVTSPVKKLSLEHPRP